MTAEMLDVLEAEVTHLLAAMPSADYDFVPGEGNFAGARTFGEQARHLATVLYLTAATLRGSRSPYPPGNNDNGPDNIQSKAETLDYVRRAFTYARTTVAYLSEAQMQEAVPSYFGQKPRADLAAGMLIHGYNHYGQLVVYARLNGITPRQP